MGSGQFSVIPHELAVDLELALGTAAEAAATSRGGWEAQRVRLGPNVLKILTTGGALASAVRLAFGPLALTPEGPSDAEIRSWDSVGTGCARPIPAWTLPGRFEGADRVFTCDVDHPQLTMSRPTDGSALVWSQDGENPAPWEASAPFRHVIDRLLGTRGTVFIHGGVVIESQRGVLLTAPGGGGKSTTVLACAAAGMSTLGDDFVMLENRCDTRTVPTVHALYATARLLPNSPVWSILEPSALPPSDKHPIDVMGKHLVSLANLFPDRMARSADLVAIAVPSREHSDARPSVKPITAAAALRALAPTTLSLTEARPGAFAAMRMLCEELPCYELRVTPDLAAVVSCVRRIAS